MLPPHSPPTPPPRGPPCACTQVLTGNWRSVLGDLDRVEGLRPGEVRDAAARWLTPDNRFRGYVLPG